MPSPLVMIEPGGNAHMQFQLLCFRHQKSPLIFTQRVRACFARRFSAWAERRANFLLARP